MVHSWLWLNEKSHQLTQECCAERYSFLANFLNHFRTPGGGSVSAAKVQEKLIVQAMKLAGIGKSSCTDYAFRFPVDSSSNDNILSCKGEIITV